MCGKGRKQIEQTTREFKKVKRKSKLKKKQT